MPRTADPALALQRRQHILDAALHCFRERGFRQTTVEDICAEARTSPGALYRLFASKGELIAAIAGEARADVEAVLGQLDDAEDLVSGLERLARSALERFDADGDGPLLAEIWAEAARDPQTAKLLLTQDERIQGRIGAAIRLAQVNGHAHAAVPAEDAAELLMSALDGMALRRAMRRSASVDDEVRRYRVLALHLLKPKR
jgi:AcrR family transcriptional regulator